MTFFPPPDGPDIIEFATSSKFLGPGRDGLGLPELSVPERATLKGIYGLPMERDERLAFLDMTEGREPRKNGYEEIVLIWGVRSGKTMFDALIGTYESARWSAKNADGTYLLQRHLLRGQIATGILIAQDRKAAGIARSYLIGNLHTLEERTGAKFLASVEGQEKAITGMLVKMAAPIEIAIFPANAYSVRGVTGLWFVGDESAFWKSEEGAYNQDEKVMKAVNSRFATLSRLRPKRLLTSSKNPDIPEPGIIWDAWKKRDIRPNVLVMMAESWTINPSLSQEFLDEKEEQDPETFAVEYGKAWARTGGGNVFLPGEIVDQCVTKGVRQRERKPGVEYVAWIDAAFKKDRFFFGIGHGESGRAVIDHVRHWTPRSSKGFKTKPLDDDEIVKEITADLRLYSTDRVTGDQYCDVPLQSKFKAHGIQFVYAPVSDPEKAEAFKNLKGAMRSSLVDLVDDEITIKDLKGLQKLTTKSGHMHISAPRRRGCYDDGANVVARIVQKVLPMNHGIDLAAVNASAMTRDFPGLDWKQPAKEGEFHGGLMEAVY